MFYLPTPFGINSATSSRFLFYSKLVIAFSTCIMLSYCCQFSITHRITMLSQSLNFTKRIKSKVGLSFPEAFDALQVSLSVSIWCLSFRRLRRTRFHGTTQDLIDDLQQMENEEAFVDESDIRSANGEVYAAFVKVSKNDTKTNYVAIMTQNKTPTLQSCFVTKESKKRSENRWHNV